MTDKSNQTSITIITWVNPNKKVRKVLEALHPDCSLNFLPWQTFRETFLRSTIRLSREKGMDIYLLIHDISQSFQIPYYEALSLLFMGNKTCVIDLFGNQKKLSKRHFLFRSLPRLMLEMGMGIFSFIFSVGFLWALKSQRVRTFLQNRTDKKSLRVADQRPRVIAYYWGFLPDVQVNLKVGGEISHIIGFLDGLEKNGYKSLLVSTRQIRHEKNPALPVPVDEKYLPAWPGEIREITYSWKAFFKTFGLIHALRPAAIYHRSSGYNFSGLIVSTLLGIPLVMEFNSSEVWEANCAGGTRFPFLLRLIEQLNATYARAMSVISVQVKDQFAGYIGIGEKIVVNPNGVDPDFFKPENADKQQIIETYGLQGKHVLGFLGVFFAYHGVLTIARAVKLVVAKIPDCHFLMIGDGLLRLAFEQIIEADGMSDFVTITGKVPHETVPSHLEACEILLSPHQNMDDGSLFFGSPTKLFEYMAMAKPIVASRLGQLAEILEHEKNALMIQPEDPQQLADAIIRLILDPDLGHRIGKNARDLVVSSYTWKQNVERVLERVITE